MSLLKPFSLRIFVADGDPDGLRLVERSNWVGKAIVFPRALLPKIKHRDELSQTGIYMLLEIIGLSISAPFLPANSVSFYLPC